MSTNSTEKKPGDNISWAENPELPEHSDTPRARRFESHALVDIRLSRWNPFATVSAVLLDLSWQGFKIEFVNTVKVQPGVEVYMVIPLAPFQIQSPSSIKMRAVVKWFDALSSRAGGIFVAQNEQHKHIIDKILLKISPEDQ